MSSSRRHIRAPKRAHGFSGSALLLSLRPEERRKRRKEELREAAEALEDEAGCASIRLRMSVCCKRFGGQSAFGWL